MKKQIRFETLGAIAEAVTAENHERLGRDMFAWIQSCVALKLLNPNMVPNAMIWTDDGEHVITGIRTTTMHATTKPSPKRRK